jgi:hypothetical protein
MGGHLADATADGAQWYMTLTDPAGRAVAHGCAHKGLRRSVDRRKGIRWAAELKGRLQLLETAPVRPRPTVRQLQATAIAAVLDRDPAAQVLVPRRPSARCAVRSRSHHAIRPGRTDLRVQLGARLSHITTHPVAGRWAFRPTTNLPKAQEKHPS